MVEKLSLKQQSIENLDANQNICEYIMISDK